jgi:hypothetical protein
MPAKPVIAQRTPCIVEVGQALSIGVNAVDRKRNRFEMDPLRGRSSRRWRFTLKRRNGWHSVAVSRRKILPSVMGLTRGSNGMLKKSARRVLVALRGSTYRSVRLASSLAVALLDGLFEHPAWCAPLVPDMQTSKAPACSHSFSVAC